MPGPWLPAIPETLPAPFRRRLQSFQWHLEGAGYSPRTVGGYLDGLIGFGRWLGAAGHPGTLDTVTADTCRQYLAALAAQPHQRTGAPLSASTVNNRGRALQSFFKWAAAEYAFPDPMERVAIPKPAHVLIPQFSDADLDRLLGAAAGKDFPARRDTAFLWLLIATGMRLNEAAGLAVADLDLKQRKVQVIGKGSKRRECVFSPKCRLALDRYLDLRDAHPFAARTGLWLGKVGPLTRSGCAQIVFDRAHAAAAACPDPAQAARLRRIGPHDLRHAAAVRYLRKGGQVDNLQALMGWDSPTMPAYYVEAAKHELAQSEYDRLDIDAGL